MAEAGTVELVELVEHLDFEPACQHIDEADQPDCSAPARWAGRASCCGFVIVRCDSHMTELAEWQRLSRIDGIPVMHDRGPNGCGRVTAYFTWTPLGGGSRG